MIVLLIALAVSAPVTGLLAQDQPTDPYATESRTEAHHILKLTGAVPLPGVAGRLDHLALDPTGTRLFVAAHDAGALEVVDLAAGTRVREITGLAGAQGVGVLPGGRVVVSEGTAGRVRLFSDSLTVLAEAGSLPDADNIRIDPADGAPWVGYGDGAVVRLDPETLKPTTRIELPGHPEAFALTSDGKLLVNVPSARAVVRADRASGKVEATWVLESGTGNFPLAVDETEGRIFVACREPAELLVLGSETGNVMTWSGGVKDADDLIYDPARKRIYLIGGGGSVDIFSTGLIERCPRVDGVPTAPGARTGILSPDGKHLYVAVPAGDGGEAEIRNYLVVH